MPTLSSLEVIMMSSNANILRVTGSLCSEFTRHRWIPSQGPVTWSCDVFVYLRLNKRLSKQSRRQWIETTQSSLWRHCDGTTCCHLKDMRCHNRGQIWHDDNSRFSVWTIYCAIRGSQLVTALQFRTNSLWNASPSTVLNLYRKCQWCNAHWLQMSVSLVRKSNNHAT